MLRRDVISAAPGKRSRLPGGVVIGDNKNTAYCHPLFVHYQIVTVRVADVTTKSKKNFYRSLSPQENKLEIA